MTLVEKAAYLADLTDLISFHEDMGQSVPNKWVLAEFNAINMEFINELKDKYDETRKS